MCGEQNYDGLKRGNQELERGALGLPVSQDTFGEDANTYQLLLNTSQDMIFIHEFNPDTDHGPFLEVNDIACSKLEYAREELIHLTPSDITVKDDLQSTPERREALYKRKELVHDKNLISKTGNVIPVEINTSIFKKGKKEFALSIARDISGRKEREKERETLIKDLRKALDEIKTLRGILPLCSFCKKIRDDKGYWEQVDVYIEKYSEADISHSICPECLEKHYLKKNE